MPSTSARIEKASKSEQTPGQVINLNKARSEELEPAALMRITRKALLSRRVEERLLRLYGEGRLSGTVHTCIGQELSGAVVTEFIKDGDAIFSNHRCHGHYLSYTGDPHGLIAEIMGKQTGVCGGRGGSQHLCRNNFYSNGIQGGIVPVATGLAMARKLRKNDRLAVVFIGDGTLGEGVIYESFNIAARWDLPLLIVLENNSYAQSTHISETLAGNIRARAEAFGIRSASADTWDCPKLYGSVRELCDYVRQQQKPAFLQIDTYRLKAHSKGDDIRNPEEIAQFEDKDWLTRLEREKTSAFAALEQEIEELIEAAVAAAELAPTCTTDPEWQPPETLTWKDCNPEKQRVVHCINNAFKQLMSADSEVLFLGEDVLSPYGGAFKVAQDLSDLFPGRVLNTPISEQAIVGIGTGLAMEGFLPFIEIMFGDFSTLVLDQIVNHAAKFGYMYNHQVQAGVVIRTPMGGGRGYGPTHSQTLDRHFMGTPGLRMVALNNLMDPQSIFQSLARNRDCPTLLIENKLMYGRYLVEKLPPGFSAFQSEEAFPTIHIAPQSHQVDLVLLGYGGTAEMMLEAADRLFEEHELVARVLCPTQIYPFSLKPLMPLIPSRTALLVVEEGQGFAGFGAEILAQARENGHQGAVARIYPEATPIPASGPLEKEVLPDVARIISRALTLV